MKTQHESLKAVASDARAGTRGAVLLAGAAGSAGVTAAETLAAELGTTVYRVDLRAVARKSIGETAKNLDDPAFLRRIRRVIDYPPR